MIDRQADRQKERERDRETDNRQIDRQVKSFWFFMIKMMVIVMSFRNHIWMCRKGGAKMPGPDLEGKVNSFSFFDDKDVGDCDDLQKPDLEWSKRGCEEARSRYGRKSE